MTVKCLAQGNNETLTFDRHPPTCDALITAQRRPSLSQSAIDASESGFSILNMRAPSDEDQGLGFMFSVTD